MAIRVLREPCDTATCPKVPERPNFAAHTPNRRAFAVVRGEDCGQSPPMTRPFRLEAPVIAAWLQANPRWSREEDTLVRAYPFPDFAGALAFAVRVGLFAERADHHPELAVRWGLATVRFSTHEPRGLTQLDIDGAEAADLAYGTTPSAPTGEAR